MWAPPWGFLTPRVLDGPDFGISNEFPGDADAAGLEPSLCKPVCTAHPTASRLCGPADALWLHELLKS